MGICRRGYMVCFLDIFGRGKYAQGRVREVLRDYLLTNWEG